MWWLTGLISFTLNMTTSTINAVLVKNTSGYSHVPVGELILLWTSRPGMAWVILSLVAVEMQDSVYLGAAASTALSEVVLQVIGLTYVGRTADYARNHDLFSSSNIAHIPDARHATIMYRGSVLVLVSASFAIIFLLAILRTMRRTILWRIQGFTTARVRPQPQTQHHFELRRFNNPNVNATLQEMRLEKDHITLVYLAVIFLVPAFIGQWMFWGGFVNLYGDLYCPPDVWRSAGIWSVFSWLGMVVSFGG